VTVFLDMAARSALELSAALTDKWTGARVAEGSGLLSRPASDRRAGSNPAPSASECATIGERGVVPASTSNLTDGDPVEAGAAPRSRKQPTFLR
jgi:hypothetical protein